MAVPANAENGTFLCPFGIAFSTVTEEIYVTGNEEERDEESENKRSLLVARETTLYILYPLIINENSKNL